MSKWTPSGTEEWTPADSIWRVLGLENGPTAATDARTRAVIPDGQGGFWLLGAIRQMSLDEEQRLSEAEEEALGPLMGRYAPPVANRAFDGALVHLDADGMPTGGAMFDEYPWRFTDREHFYTFRRLESGLVQVRIWKFERSCR